MNAYATVFSKLDLSFPTSLIASSGMRMRRVPITPLHVDSKLLTTLSVPVTRNTNNARGDFEMVFVLSYCEDEARTSTALRSI